MTDPLSVAAGVSGVVIAAAQISSLLFKFINSTIAAPQQAKVVLTEVSDIGGILSHLQSFLLGLDLPDRSRTSLLRVEKVVTIVSGCVVTFSELEKLLDELKTGDLDIVNRLKWARKESAITRLIQRLQNHKASLSLVLDILNGQTIAEAKDSVDRLHIFVEKCYKEMSSRVQALEVLYLQNDDASQMSEEDTESLETIRPHQPDARSEEIIESEIEDTEFSDELQKSRVYKRNQAFRISVISTLTDSVRSLGWSFFSDLSMAEVSTVSVINLAVTEREVFNSRRSLQTWSAQPNGGFSMNDHADQQRTPPYKVIGGPAQANTSAAIVQERWAASERTQQQSLSQPHSPLPKIHPFEDPNNNLQEFGEENGSRYPSNMNLLSFPLPLNLVSVSPSPAQAPFSPQSPEVVEDDLAYLCKSCGEILEERKAYRLDCEHWHIDCVCCNTCYILLLDSAEPNLRVPKYVSVCKYCTYECSDCHSTMEDPQFMAGDEAFCATCFKCWNCKKTIKSLGYARTSQGIFCLKCYQSLMQRHRKKDLAKGKLPERKTRKSLTASTSQEIASAAARGNTGA